MTSYGTAAVNAAHLLRDRAVSGPLEAWARAVSGMPKSCRVKSCPKGTFLGLCEEGLVRGIPRGTYTRSEKNKRYGVRAVQILRSHSAVAWSAAELWSAVQAGVHKEYNDQMDIVLALWNAGLIER